MLHFLQSEVTEVTEYRWPGAPEPWITFLILLVVVLIVGYCYWREVGKKPLGILLSGLRIGAFVVALIIFFQLVQTTERFEVKDSSVVVILDRSLSMTFRDKYGSDEATESLARVTDLDGTEAVERLDRMGLVKRALVNEDLAWIEALRENHRVLLYTFADRARPLAELHRAGSRAARDDDEEESEESSEEEEEEAGPREPVGVDPVWAEEQLEGRDPALRSILAIEPNGTETSLPDSVNQVLNDLRGQRLAGVVVLSDGRTNSNVMSVDGVARRAARQNIPVYTVAVGNPREPKDIALSDLMATKIAYAGDVVTFDFVATSRGYEGVQVDVELRFNGNPVKNEPLVLKGRGEKQPVSIQYVTEKPGEYTCVIRVPPRAGEITEENNELVHRLRVTDQRPRVLYVEGLPRWEYRYLKNTLIRNRNIAAQCLLISADPNFPQESSEGLPPLKSFPSDRESLFKYHVIIIGDVPASFFERQDPELPGLIKEFVDDYGGGLLMIAGENHAPDSYRNSPIASVLPVVIEEDLGPLSTQQSFDELFRLRLTDDGREHKIMRLENDPEANEELWEDRDGYGDGLPGFYWYQPVQQAKPFAKILAVHPYKRNKKGPLPIVVVKPAGAGLSMFVGVDSTWRWRAGIGDKYFNRFWTQSVKYLSSERLQKTQRYSLTTDKTEYLVGEKVIVSATVRDATMKYSTEETQTVHGEAPDGSTFDLELQATQRQGYYQGTMMARKLGNYQLRIGPEEVEPGEEEEQARRSFQVKVPLLEFTEPRLDATTLRRIAQESGGLYLGPLDVEGLATSVARLRSQAAEVQGAQRRRTEDRIATLRREFETIEGLSDDEIEGMVEAAKDGARLQYEADLTAAGLDQESAEAVMRAMNRPGLSELSRLVEGPDRIRRYTERRPIKVSEDEIWDRWYMLLLLVILLTGEWIVRKIVKLV